MAVAAGPGVQERPAPAAARFQVSDSLDASIIQRLGVFFGALFLFSVFSYINEIVTLATGVGPHLLTGSALGVLLCGIVGGGLFRPLKTRLGILWLTLLLWGVICVPFSTWRTASLNHIGDAAKYHFLVYLLCTLAVSPAQVRTLLMGALGGGLALAACAGLFGQLDSGRLIIRFTSMGNPNELALRLLGAATLTLFAIARPNKIIRAIGVLGFLGTIGLMFRTGSRGSFVALMITAAAVFLVSSGRIRTLILIASGCAAVVVLLVTPPATMQRLFMLTTENIETPTDESALSADQQGKAMMSEVTREMLLIRGLQMTLRNPIFGVGPSQFPEMLFEYGKEEGRHLPAQRPHNTYVQLAAEYGLPGLFIYTAVIVSCIVMNYRVLREARGDVSDPLIYAQTLALFAYSIAFSANTLFVHLLSVEDAGPLVGLSLANWLAYERWKRSRGTPEQARMAVAV